MIGPFDKPPFPIFCVNPIGITTRKYSGKERLIIDLSAPHGSEVPSINGVIPFPDFSMQNHQSRHKTHLFEQGKGTGFLKQTLPACLKFFPFTQIFAISLVCFGKGHFTSHFVSLLVVIVAPKYLTLYQSSMLDSHQQLQTSLHFSSSRWLPDREPFFSSSPPARRFGQNLLRARCPSFWRENDRSIHLFRVLGHYSWLFTALFTARKYLSYHFTLVELTADWQML